MSEAEWLACGDPQLMLPPFPSRASVRTARLLMAACCRAFGSLLDPSTGARRDELLTMMESRADVVPSETWGDAVTADAEHAYPYEEVEGCSKIAECYFMIQHGGLMPCVGILATNARAMGAPDPARLQAAFIRDIFGNPFRPVTLDSTWRTSDVVALARGIYEDRAFDRMPILADALQDAGCDRADVLNHCRELGPHVRGCWAVDAVLNKE